MIYCDYSDYRLRRLSSKIRYDGYLLCGTCKNLTKNNYMLMTENRRPVLCKKCMEKITEQLDNDDLDAIL